MKNLRHTVIVVLIAITLSPLSGALFNTVLGPCDLHFVSNDPATIEEIQGVIVAESHRLVGEYGAVNPHPWSVHVVSSREQLRNLTRGYAPEWSVGVAQRKLNQIVMLAPNAAKVNFNRFLEILVHELNHIYMHRIAGMDAVPAWFTEGLAMVASGELSLIQKIEISRALWGGKLFTLDQLHNMQVHYSWDVDQAYAQSAAAVYGLQYFYGDGILRAILDILRYSDDFEAAFQELTGNDLLDFQEKYSLYLNSNYRWIFLLRASRYIFVVLPVILVAGFIIKRRRGRRKLELWDLEEKLASSDYDPPEVN